MAKDLVLLALDPLNFPSVTQARLALQPGQKHPENPVLAPRPGEWDGTRCKVYGTVFVDPNDGLFKMWYCGSTDTPDAVRRECGAPRSLGYAYSQDGVHWHRPNLGLIEYNGSKENNLLLLNAQAPSVFIQEDEPDPQKRFLMITEAGQDTNHTHILHSPDGIHWTAEAAEPMPGGEWTQRLVHEPFSILHDPLDPDPKRRWKGYSLLHERDEKGYRGRAVGLFMSDNPARWIEYPKQPIFSAVDGLESEIHIPHVSRMHDTYVLLFDAMEPNHHTQMEVAVSDDGVSFRRVCNGVKLLANGLPGEVDGGKICVSPRSLFEHDGKIWWYCKVSPDTYQTSPRGMRAQPWYVYTLLAQWRQDGFARLETIDASPAEIISRPILLESRRLPSIWINGVVPAADGSLAAEIIDSSGKTLARSAPWRGDHLRGGVSWEKPQKELETTSVRIRIRLAGLGSAVYAIGIDGARRSEAKSVFPAIVPKRDPRIGWQFQARAKFTAAPALDADRIYIGSWDDHLYAVNRSTGKPDWVYEAGGSIVGGAAVHDGKVFFGSRDNSVYCLSTADGKLLWKRPIREPSRKLEANANGPWVESPAAAGAFSCPPVGSAESPHRFYIGAHDRELHSFDPNTGTEEWRFPTFNWILSRPEIAHYTVYFGSIDRRIYAVDARCGALQWYYEIGRAVQYSPSLIPNTTAGEGVCGSPLCADGVLYCGGDDGYMYALDAATGREKWIFQTGKWIWGKPLLTNGVLVVASADGSVYGLHPGTGTRVWQTATGNANYTDVVSFQDRALVACTSGRLHAIDPATGKNIWIFDADGGLRSTPAVGGDGTIYLASATGTLYALRVSE